MSTIEKCSLGKYSITDLAAKYNISEGLISNWITKGYNGIEIKDYDPKGDVYTMKSKKITFKWLVEIVRSVFGEYK